MSELSLSYDEFEWKVKVPWILMSSYLVEIKSSSDLIKSIAKNRYFCLSYNYSLYIADMKILLIVRKGITRNIAGNKTD